MRRFRGRLDSGGGAPILSPSTHRREHGEMSGTVEARLKSLGLELPVPAAPIANYVPFTRSGPVVVISGQIPLRDGKMQYVGKLGAGMSIEDAQAAAKLCALNILAQLKAAAGNLDNVRRCLRL